MADDDMVRELYEGRWWLVGGKQDKESYVFWTDDGGRSWSKTLVDPADSVGGVEVSADGSTAVAFTLGVTTGGPVRLRVSTDHGKTWTTTAPRERTWSRPPVALNDGNILLLEKGKLLQLNGPEVATAPKDAVELRGDDDLLYVAIGSDTGESTSIATSTGLGKTWKTLQPR